MWSYEINSLETSLKDQIRLRIGDTDESDPVMQDEEIMFYIGNNETITSSVLLQCLEVCITRISSLPEYQLGPYSESHKARLENWNHIKNDLKTLSFSQHAPMSSPPTTEPIFGYDIMSSHCCGGNPNE